MANPKEIVKIVKDYQENKKKNDERMVERLIEINRAKMATIDELKDELENIDNSYYNRKDIERIFDCEAEKARGILKYALQLNLATRVGNQIVISRKNLRIFLEDYYKGKKISIT